MRANLLVSNKIKEPMLMRKRSTKRGGDQIFISFHFKMRETMQLDVAFIVQNTSQITTCIVANAHFGS